jgi:hypothetical protein
MTPRVEVDPSDLVEVYRTLNLIVASLGRFGSWTADQTPEAAAAGLVTLHDDMGLFALLATARQTLDEYFDDTVGDDGMSELEREVANEDRYWTPPS